MRKAMTLVGTMILCGPAPAGSSAVPNVSRPKSLQVWQERNEKLYELAGEVTRATGGK